MQTSLAKIHALASSSTYSSKHLFRRSASLSSHSLGMTSTRSRKTLTEANAEALLRSTSKWARREWDTPSSTPARVLEHIQRLPKSSQHLRSKPPSHPPNLNSYPHPNRSASLSAEHEYISNVPQHILTHKSAMKRLFPLGWAPPKKLSREAMDGLRSLHEHDPDAFTTPELAKRFKISPEAVRRILKSKWRPDERRMAKIAEREKSAREHMIWTKQLERRAALGLPARGVGDHSSIQGNRRASVTEPRPSSSADVASSSSSRSADLSSIGGLGAKSQSKEMPELFMDIESDALLGLDGNPPTRHHASPPRERRISGPGMRSHRASYLS
jgi:hypothetical protein